ncbi:MAG: Ku protein [Pirellulales bacterium]
MASRAIWKAVIRVGEGELPVKLYSAVQDQAIHFHLLHDQDLVRIKQRLVNPNTDATVAYEDTQRGVEVGSQKIVILEQAELEALVPEESRDINVGPFIPRGEIGHQSYDRPYYLGPDGNEDDYFAFAQALAKSEREGIAQWTMRKKAYVGSLLERDGYLMLITLRHAGEVIDSSELTPPEGRALEKKEQQLARQLVEALTDDFEPDEYQDTYRERVRKLINAKQRNETFQVEEYEEKFPSDSLADSLEASIQAARS